MNNTIKNKNKVLNEKNLNATFNFKEEYLNIWDKRGKPRKKRNKNFSFIFQSNNLFNNVWISKYYIWFFNRFL